MEVSQQIQGTHAAVSPSGQYTASIANGKVRIHLLHAPEHFTESNIRIQQKDIASIGWNSESDRVVVLSRNLIEVLDLHNDSHRVRLDNGSGSLGKFALTEFLDADHLLVVWKFGKARVWDVSTGRALDLADVKTTCNGEAWQARPKDATATRLSMLASLSRSGAEDVLSLHVPASRKTIKSIRLPTVDAQALSWSPSGQWLAVLDTPTTSTSVYFFTATGDLFRSYHHYKMTRDTPALRHSMYTLASSHHSSGLTVKAIAWSNDPDASANHHVALSCSDGKVVVLSAKTFTTVAVIEHHGTIFSDPAWPTHVPLPPVWRERNSPSGERSFVEAPRPISLPLSKAVANPEPKDIGVAEACFSSAGYLATRDGRMLSTIWIWDLLSMQACAMIVHHNNVRKLHWHLTHAGRLLVDCSESIVYVYDVNTPRQPPRPIATSLHGAPSFTWLPSPSANSLPSIISSTKTSFQLLYPQGRPEPQSTAAAESEEADEGEDSLLDLLSGRKPLPESYTQQVDLEVETADEADSTMRMEDTFRGKQVFSRTEHRNPGPQERDPLDDSQIF